MDSTSRTTTSAAQQAAIDSDPRRDSFANQLDIELRLGDLRVHNELRRTKPTIAGPGAVAKFPNAILVRHNRLLAVKTDVEPGTIIPADSYLLVNWETHDGGSRYGHMRGTWVYVVGNPTGPVPQPTYEILAGHKTLGPVEDMVYFPFAETEHVTASSRSALQEEVRMISSPRTRSDIYDRLVFGEGAPLLRILHDMYRKALSANNDRRGTDPEDIHQEVNALFTTMIDRFASPDRPLNAAMLTNAVMRPVRDRVGRATAAYAGISQRDAAFLSKARAADVDLQADSHAAALAKLAEHGDPDAELTITTAQDTARLERLRDADRLNSPASLNQPLQIDGATHEIQDLCGALDPHYDAIDSADQTWPDALRRMAHHHLHGSGVEQTDTVVDAVAAVIHSFLVEGNAPTRDDLADPTTGWPIFSWIFKPLLTIGDSWLKPGARGHIADEFQNLGFASANKWRQPRDVAAAWSAYLESDRHQVRSDDPPLGVVLTD
jgi:hypothetical protein